MHAASNLTGHEISSRKHRRGGIRAYQNFPVEVCGYTRSGEFFTERTLTVNVSEQGCQVALQREIEVGRVFGLRRLGPLNEGSEQHRTWLFRPVWVESHGGIWSVGARKLDPEPLWIDHASAQVATASA